MSDINLSSAVRSSLTSLQSTANLLSSTQERLATGNRVNSALDDPTAFFTATALNDRASDLSTLLDEQNQAIQVIQAADNGITAIQDLVDSARAIANQALQTDDASERGTLAAQFDAILGQIEALAGDASFNGINLLDSVNSQDLQVVFNEDGSSSLTVAGVNFTDVGAADGLNLQRVSTAGTAAVPATSGTTETTGFDFANVSNGDTITLNDGSGGSPLTITFGTGGGANEIDATSLTNQADLISAVQGLANTAFGSGVVTVSAGTGTELSLSSTDGNVSFSFDDANNTGSAVTASGTSTNFAAGTAATGATGFATNEDINDTLAAIDSALGTLRTTAATLGTNLSTIQIRSDFTENLINTLEVGAGNLTLADLNEEGANLLTLQTRQQLASTSLSFATQADQAVLSLFG